MKRVNSGDLISARISWKLTAPCISKKKWCQRRVCLYCLSWILMSTLANSNVLMPYPVLLLLSSRLERSKVRVTFFQSSQPQCVSPPDLFGDTNNNSYIEVNNNLGGIDLVLLNEGEYSDDPAKMAAVVAHMHQQTHQLYDRQNRWEGLTHHNCYQFNWHYLGWGSSIDRLFIHLTRFYGDQRPTQSSFGEQPTSKLRLFFYSVSNEITDHTDRNWPHKLRWRQCVLSLN